MKFYVIKRKTSNQWHAFVDESIFQLIEPNGAYVKAINAFFKRKEAKAYLETWQF